VTLESFVYRTTVALMLLSWAAFLALLVALGASFLFPGKLDGSIPAQIMVGALLLRYLFQFWLSRLSGNEKGIVKK
jgi:hypothetical protein